VQAGYETFWFLASLQKMIRLGNNAQRVSRARGKLLTPT